MFGKRSTADATRTPGPAAQSPAQSVPPAPAPQLLVDGGRAPIPSNRLGTPSVPGTHSAGQTRAVAPPIVPTATDSRHSEEYYETKGTIFGALIEAIDIGQLAKLDTDSAREEIRDIINEIIGIKSIVMSISEQEELLEDICNDVLGYGPLEPLLARDDIADIMVNGSGTTYIEVAGRICPVSRQPAAFEHLSAHRQPDRTARGRGLADLRCAASRRISRERHRTAARD